MKKNLLTNVLPGNVEDRRNDPAGAQRFDQGVAPNRGRGDATFRSDAFGHQLPYVGSDYYVSGDVQFNGQLLKDNENPRFPTAASQSISSLPVLSSSAKAGPEAVMEWQRFLNQQGAYVEVDGVFGGKTAAATRDLQKRLGVRADGIVGTKTRNAAIAVASMPMPNLRPDGSLPPPPAPAPAAPGVPMPNLRPNDVRHIGGFAEWQKEVDPKSRQAAEFIAKQRGVPVETYLFQVYQHAMAARVPPPAPNPEIEKWKTGMNPAMMNLVTHVATSQGVPVDEYLASLRRRTTAETLAPPKRPGGKPFQKWVDTIDPGFMHLISGVARLKDMTTDAYLREVYDETQRSTKPKAETQ